jgi:hypothetical protein
MGYCVLTYAQKLSSLGVRVMGQPGVADIRLSCVPLPVEPTGLVLVNAGRLPKEG